MKKYEAIEMCIAKKDIKALRAKVGSLCYTCRDFSDGEFDEMVKYIEKKTSLDKGTQRKTTENELPSLTQCTA